MSHPRRAPAPLAPAMPNPRAHRLATGGAPGGAPGGQDGGDWPEDIGRMVRVHVTDHRGVITAYAREQALYLQWRARLTAWLADRRLPDRVKMGRRHVEGVYLPAGVGPPPGWRRVSGEPGLIVPSLRTKSGLKLAGDLGAMGPPPDWEMGVPGIHVRYLTRAGLAIASLEMAGGSLWALWSLPVPIGAADRHRWEPSTLRACQRAAGRQRRPGTPPTSAA